MSLASVQRAEMIGQFFTQRVGACYSIALSIGAD